MQSLISLLTLRNRIRLHVSELYPNRLLRASNGCTESFFRRQDLKSICNHGTGGSPSPDGTETDTRKLPTKMERISVDMIFKLDEAASFYKFASTCSYAKAQAAHTTKGTPLRRDKARLAAVACVKATGTC